MQKKITHILHLLLPLLFIGHTSLFAQCNGNFTINSQEELDAFMDNGCTNINGYLLISGSGFTNLSGLENLTSIGGDLRIYACSNLVNLAGLENLNFIGGAIEIKKNTALSQIQLPQLNSLGTNSVEGGFAITQNNALTSIDNFYSLEKIYGDFRIVSNPSLESITGFDALTEIQIDLIISDNLNLTDISGLQNLTDLSGDLVIRHNFNLPSIDLQDLNIVKGEVQIAYNTSLEGVNTLINLEEVYGDFTVAHHPLNNFPNLRFIRNELILEEYSQVALNAFPTLEYLNRFNVYNTGLVEIDFSFPKAIEIDQLEISYNSLLEKITGLNQVFTTSRFRITNNSAIKSVEGFANLNNVDNYLSIRSCSYLNSLSGFENLKHVGNLGIWYTGLKQINFFPSIESIESLTISSNLNLINIDGQPHFINIGSLIINYNPNLEKIAGFSEIDNVLISITGNYSLEKIEGFNKLKQSPEIFISNNDALTQIDAFTQLKELGKLTITKNELLSHLGGFEQLKTVQNAIDIESNFNLKTIDAFPNLTSIGSFILENNILLKEFSPLSSLVLVNDSITLTTNYQLASCCQLLCWDQLANGTTILAQNEESCNSLEAIEANCDQNTCWDIEPTIESLTAYPIPTEDKLTLNFDAFVTDLVLWERTIFPYKVWNLNGQLVDQNAVYPIGANLVDYPNRNFSFDVSKYESGIYVLKLFHPETGEAWSVRFIKQ